MKPASLGEHIVWDNAFIFSSTVTRPSISAAPLGIISLKGRKPYEKGIIARKKKVYSRFADARALNANSRPVSQIASIEKYLLARRYVKKRGLAQGVWTK